METKERFWRLPQLLAASGISAPGAVPDIPIRQVTDDSRAVERDTLFVAIRGLRQDGHRFVAEAIERGARAVLVEEPCPMPPGIFQLQVPAVRPLAGPLVSAFLDFPSRRLRVVGVTGTNGKTTVTWLVQHLLERAGLSCGLIGTVCCRVGADEQPSKNTTPGAVSLQGMLSTMADEGLAACAMEVSSHALDQYRTDGMEWTCGVFTNVTPEHLDYHGTMTQYLQAKLRLFEALAPSASAVVNREDPAWQRIRERTRASLLTYGFHNGADLFAEEIRCSLDETVFRIRTPEGSFAVAFGLIGRHNIENLLAALGAVISCGIPVKKALEGLRSFPGVPGRLERIEEGQPFPVFIDYAHTDDALRRILTQLRAVTRRRIEVVFGCGGDRDRTKRPRMGRAAAQLADRVIITSDNPRSEDPQEIALEVASGIPEGSTTPCGIILDRREAIRCALEEAADTNSLVLIAGKGHETEQIIGERVIPFDDRRVARELLGTPKETALFRPSQIAAATGAVCVKESSSPEAVSGVSIDSRTIRPGELYVAIRGRRFDGHDFVGEAFSKGAAGAVVDHWPMSQLRSPVKGAVWVVTDTLKALGDLAEHHRKGFSIDVVAITGSSGKTTTKAMLTHLLSGRNALFTPGTQNNQIGVPMALLALRPQHEVAVVELGTNRWGEVRRLARIAHPTLGVVTNIGPAHLETFGDLAGVLREKEALWEEMDHDRPVILPSDDPLVREESRQLSRRVIWFGTDTQADVRASRILLEPWGSRSLVNDRWELRLPLPGRHNLLNALAALASAQVLGEEISSAVNRLANVSPLSGRLSRMTIGGCLVIHDAYNANPASLKAALDVLKGVDCPGRRILAVGDMLELGPRAEDLHAEAGRWVRGCGAQILVAVGPLAKILLTSALSAGFPEEAARAFDSAEEAGDFLMERIQSGDVILLKGSRGMRMERILECFTTSFTH